MLYNNLLLPGSSLEVALLESVSVPLLSTESLLFGLDSRESTYIIKLITLTAVVLVLFTSLVERRNKDL